MIKFQRWFCTPKSRILVPQNSAPLDEQNPVKWSGEACFWFCYSCNDKARLPHDFARLCLRHSVKNTHHKPPSRFWRRTSCDFWILLCFVPSCNARHDSARTGVFTSKIQNPESRIMSQLSRSTIFNNSHSSDDHNHDSEFWILLCDMVIPHNSEFWNSGFC